MSSKKHRIFMVNQGDDSQRFGVGKYISEMIKEAQSRKEDYQMIIITVGVNGIYNVQKRQKKNITYLDLPKPFLNGQELLYGLSKQLSLGIFSIVMDYFTITGDDIFHFNSNMQHFLVRKIKESTNAKIVYTAHVSMWNVLYHNNEEKFLCEWNDPDCFSINKRNILAEIDNCELADRVIGLSNNTVNDLRKYYKVSETKLKRIFNGISSDSPKIDHKKLHHIRNVLRLKKIDFVFLFAGRVNEQKGISDLLEAFNGLYDSATDHIKLIVVGDGSLKDKLRGQIQENNIVIQFVGYVPQNEIHYYYKLSDAIVIPSLYDQNPYTILEAMAYKVPMIVTDIDAFTKLESGSVCLKVPLKNETKVDIATLQKQMQLLVEKPELGSELTKNAYELLLQNFSSTQMFNKTYQF